MSSIEFNGKTAVVTGSSLGIGRSTALALGRAGAKVVVNYRSHAAAAEEVVRAIIDSGSEAVAVQGDVSDQQAVEELVAEAVGRFGSLDIAIANAAYSARELFHQADMDGFRRTIDVTMWGAFYLLRAAASQMIQQGRGGVFVAVSSPHAFIPVPKSMAYNMAKAAIDQMVKTAALEVAPYGIRVNTMHPGWTDTPGERRLASEEDLQRAGKLIPLGRLGTAEEIADAILFLCDPRQSYMTGASVLVDGGISLPWHWGQSHG
jgi:glucose 1-dehydrogenase